MSTRSDLYIELPGEFELVEHALKAFEEDWRNDPRTQDYELPQLAGGSGRGWSFYARLERCPRAFYLWQESRKVAQGDAADFVVVESKARAIGSIFHAFLALRYLGELWDLGEKRMPHALYNFLAKRNINPEALYDAWRVFQAYLDYYEGDYLIPLAVEHSAIDKRTGRTCRYDLIARIEKGDAHLSPGIYNVEHKTASAFTSDVLDGWDLDGEILGQIALWERAGLDKTFGPLTGVIVNICGKQRVPEFHRTIVLPQSFHTKRHLRVLTHLDEMERVYRRKRYWPQFFNGCIGRYGRCEFYDHCANEGLQQ